MSKVTGTEEDELQDLEAPPLVHPPENPNVPLVNNENTPGYPDWLNRRSRTYDDGRPFMKVPETLKVILTITFALIGIHTVALKGYPT
ncbi:hypothetical protein L6452_40191 [Arctium lappa]|uniref:Uncharacterized protein n=1 Tax=Arctium lappa TaxID=4217 RepID=A0ACB8XQC9_ARCLA|nr:hypothetical protein L6452_40191 [Arctium lappa]